MDLSNKLVKRIVCISATKKIKMSITKLNQVTTANSVFWEIV